MRSDETTETKQLEYPTASDLEKISKGRMELDRTTAATIADCLLKASEERDIATNVIANFRAQVYRDNLQMLDEVFLPDNFSIHTHTDINKETGEQHIVYIGENCVMHRSNELGQFWDIRYIDHDKEERAVRATLSNAYEALNLFKCLGISYKIVSF